MTTISDPIAASKGVKMSYPDLPKSVHPGVLSGQAMVDLLDHAKANGTCTCACACTSEIILCSMTIEIHIAWI